MKKRLLFILIPLLLFYGLPIGAVEKEERHFQDETIYYITIDRFNNSDFHNNFDVVPEEPEKYHGGDFQGIIDRLDYIKDMGFTTIALSPIFDNEENGFHGHWVKDFYNTEEHFGTVEKFKELVNQAHEKEMNVMVDFVLTDDENLLDVGKWWLKETDIDGYRLDLVEGMSLEELENFSKELKAVKESIYLLLDTRDSDIVAQFENIKMDGVFNYSLNEELRTAFAQPIQSTEQKTVLLDNDSYIHFMDNPYTERFTRDTVKYNEHPGPRWKLALTYLYTTPGVPFVFYGSEIALDGGEAPDNLRQMDFRTDKELIDYISIIGDLRQQLPSLTRGTFELLHEKDGFMIYKREFEGETSVIALNNSTKSQSATITSLEDNMELRGLLNSDLVRSEEGKYQIILDRDEAEIYLLAEKTGLNIPTIVASASVIVLFLIFLILVKRRSRQN